MSRVLVVQLARFGDLVQTKRLILSLENQGHEVHLCLDRSLADLARLVYPRAVLHPIQAHAGGLTAAQAARAVLEDNRQAFAALRDADFAAVYNLNYSGLNFRLAGLFDRALVRGYAQHKGQPLKGFWPDLAMHWSIQRRLGLNLVDFWAGYAPKMAVPDSVNPAAEPGGAGLGVVLAGRESRRSLPPKALARLVETLYDRTGQGAIRLLGSKAEAELGRALMRELRPPYGDHCENLTGKTDWAGLVQALAGLDAVLTPDTGTMHLACHLGTPVLAVFLSSAWCFETGPYGAGHRVLQAVDSCLPCLESRPCPYRVRCRAPLEDPALARYLHTDKPGHLPAGLLDLSTGFDRLGVVYQTRAGSDEDTVSRENFRRFLGRHLGLSSEAGGCFREAQWLYREAHWMAPECLGPESFNPLD